MNWRSGLFVTTLELFETFVAEAPASPADEAAWSRLEATAWRMHDRAADATAASPGHQLVCLRGVADDLRACVALVRALAPSRTALRAWQRLDAVAGWLDRAVANLPEVMPS